MIPIMLFAAFICAIAGDAAASIPSEDWITGTWKGVLRGRDTVDVTLKLAYDPSTGRISGEADLQNRDRPFTAKWRILDGRAKNQSAITITVLYIGGQADGEERTFELEKQKDGSMTGGGQGPKNKWIALQEFKKVP